MTNTYFEIPLYASFSWNFWRGFGVFINAGGYMGVWTKSHAEGRNITISSDYYSGNAMYYYSFDEDVPFSEDRDNRFDGGLLAGLGLCYAFSGFTLFVEGRFNYGLTDMQKDYMINQVPRYNDTWIVQAGVLFNSGIFNLKKQVRGNK